MSQIDVISVRYCIFIIFNVVIIFKGGCCLSKRNPSYRFCRALFKSMQSITCVQEMAYNRSTSTIQKISSVSQFLPHRNCR